MIKDFSTRLKYFRSIRDLTQAELARLVGVSGKQISDYEVDSSKPRQSTFIKILKALNVSEEVFNNADLCSFDISDLHPDENIIFTNNDNDKLILPKSFCIKYNLEPIGDLSLYRVRGDSMSPTLLDGDLVLIDKSDNEIVSGALYLVFLYGEKLIGRLFRNQQGFILERDNEKYKSLSAISNDAIVIGKVVFRQGLI
ncbi:S24 family peptidase [Acinetobacter puyangensis]|uniref:S24 family peptidase n=1 Tax=Acinetobacter puyangensis TaxID=1096779 RepID=UPI003A4DA2CD